jgi:hypothetical protein
MFSCPPPGLFHDSNRPRLDRRLVQVPIQFGSQLGGARVTRTRFLLQALQADRLQVAGHIRIEQTGRSRFVLEHLHQRVERCFGAEGRPAGEQFVEDRAEGIDVACRTDLAPPTGRLLGRHVAGCSQRLPRGRHPVVAFDPFGHYGRVYRARSATGPTLRPTFFGSRPLLAVQTLFLSTTNVEDDFSTSDDSLLSYCIMSRKTVITGSVPTQ